MRRLINGLTMCMLTVAVGCGPHVPSTVDFAHATDMTMDAGISDLATIPGPDMAYAIPVPPGCNTATVVTGTAAFTTLNTGNRCTSGCHTTANIPKFTSQATFMTATINIGSTSAYKYVVPLKPDSSYLLYKLRNLQLKVPNGGGMQMPRGQTPLNDTDFCTVYNWVLHGAPAL